MKFDNSNLTFTSSEAPLLPNRLVKTTRTPPEAAFRARSYPVSGPAKPTATTTVMELRRMRPTRAARRVKLSRQLIWRSRDAKPASMHCLT